MGLCGGCNLTCLMIDDRCSCRDVVIQLHVSITTVAILHKLFMEVASRPESALGIEHNREVEALEIDIGRETSCPAWIGAAINLLIAVVNLAIVVPIVNGYLTFVPLILTAISLVELLQGIVLVTIHGVHGYTLVSNHFGVGIVAEHVQWLADEPVVGYLIYLTVTQLLNLVPVAGKVHVGTPREVLLVNNVELQAQLDTSVLNRTNIEGRSLLTSFQRHRTRHNLTI